MVKSPLTAAEATAVTAAWTKVMATDVETTSSGLLIAYTFTNNCDSVN